MGKGKCGEASQTSAHHAKTAVILSVSSSAVSSQVYIPIRSRGTLQEFLFVILIVGGYEVSFSPSF